MSSSNNPFKASVALMLEEIKSNKVLRRSTHTNRLEFAIHVCLVAYGVRTGYLVDAVYPPDPANAFNVLLTTLRRKSAVFKDVMFWHHTPTMQSFCVHVPLLQGKITAMLAGAKECVFVKLDKYLSVSSDLPHALQEALYGVRSVITESPDALMLSLSESFAQEILVPLAAVVIDYPVAYVPASSTQTSFLEGEPLDIYMVFFEWTSEPLDDILGFGKEHVLLRFSCPRALASSHTELSSSTVVRRLHVKFAAVLWHIGAFLSVTHSTETLGRVAL